MNNSLHMPGYRITEYRLVVPLPEVLQDKITGLRKHLFDKHGIQAPADLKPAITLLKCHAYEKDGTETDHPLAGNSYGPASFFGNAAGF